MTIATILSTHGSLSSQLLKTTEMIIGEQKNVACVNLLPEENTDTLIKKYNTHLSNLMIDKGVLFLVDIWGGSPFNAANFIIENKENCDIITGINVPMLIETFMARDEIQVLKKLVQIILQSGYKSIKSVKYSEDDYCKNNVVIKNDENATTVAAATKSNSSINDDPKNHMKICIARIDDRLIHGQVVMRWAKEHTINRIIVVNDEISKDLIRKALLTQVTPPGITAHVLDINKTIRVYNNPKYSEDKVMMLFTNPTDILRLVKEGIPIHSVNIGGMAFRQGKKQINNAISVDEIDIKAFEQLAKYNIDLEIRKVPSDPSLKIMQLIKKYT